MNPSIFCVSSSPNTMFILLHPYSHIPEYVVKSTLLSTVGKIRRLPALVTTSVADKSNEDGRHILISCPHWGHLSFFLVDSSPFLGCSEAAIHCRRHSLCASREQGHGLRQTGFGSVGEEGSSSVESSWQIQQRFGSGASFACVDSTILADARRDARKVAGDCGADEPEYDPVGELVRWMYS